MAILIPIKAGITFLKTTIFKLSLFKRPSTIKAIEMPRLTAMKNLISGSKDEHKR